MDNEQSELPQEESPASLDPTAAESDEPSSSRRGNGTVACLPKKDRDKVCFMLLDGVRYAAIAKRLAEADIHVTAEHIRRWHEHGYKRWYAEYMQNQALRDARESALDILEVKAGPDVQDAGRSIASAQLYELLKTFNPVAFAGALAEKPELYLRLIGALSRLSEGDAACSHHRAQDSLIQAKLQTAGSGPEAKIPSGEQLKELARHIKLI